MSGFLLERSVLRPSLSQPIREKLGKRHLAQLHSHAGRRNEEKTRQALSVLVWLRKKPALCKQSGFFYGWISAGTQRAEAIRMPEKIRV
ncbi:MAG: hypothetical protein LRY66_10695 [Saccharospirillaceae bacterium]|nr:hypothetical protein [Saccharospirillaceae bacterium]MCD8531801.1 hypothetical protein [Saccharospirillaceae bacterium]